MEQKERLFAKRIPGFDAKTNLQHTPDTLGTANGERQTANCYGVVDGIRTRNSWNHNPGLYR